MSTEENKALAYRYVEEIWTMKNMAVIDEIFAPDFVYYFPDGTTMRGTEALKSGLTRFRSAFPDMHLVLEDVCAEGDTVAFRWTSCGTHTGEIVLGQPIPPTGKQVTWFGIDIFHIAGGMVVEVWHSWDRSALLQQLGVVPTSG